MREVFLTWGSGGFLLFKVLVTALTLSIPLFMYLRYRESVYWTTAGFLCVFAIGGALAAIDNFVFLMNGHIWIDPVVLMGLIFSAVVVVLKVGEIVDYSSKEPFKISDERWEKMKAEMAYPQ
ncbi:MAG: hypothetical protein ACXQT5_05140 [Candidatus Syntropharchaeia archaeon]